MFYLKSFKKEQLRNFENPPHWVSELTKNLRRLKKYLLVNSIDKPNFLKAILMLNEQQAETLTVIIAGMAQECPVEWYEPKINSLASSLPLSFYQKAFSPDPIALESFEVSRQSSQYCLSDIYIDFRQTQVYLETSPNPKNLYFSVKALQDYQTYLLVLHNVIEKDGELIYDDLSYIGGFFNQTHALSWGGKIPKINRITSLRVSQQQAWVINSKLVPKRDYAGSHRVKLVLNSWGGEVQNYNQLYYQVKFPPGWTLKFDDEDYRYINIFQFRGIIVGQIKIFSDNSSYFCPRDRFSKEVISEGDKYQLRAFDRKTGELLSCPRLIDKKQLLSSKTWWDKQIKKVSDEEYIETQLLKFFDEWLIDHFKNDFCFYDWT